jgi:dienelactone hydrolase
MLWSNPLDIRVTGLSPGQEATVTARFTGWGSSATFAADASGAIDLATAAPLAGPYDGVDADGLVWSMTPSTSPDDPANDPYGLRVRVDVDGSTVANAELTRLAKTPDVTCVDVTDMGLVGTFCTKGGAPAAGAVIAFGGSEGGLSTGKSYAAYLASLGYPSLGVAYFGAPGVPDTLSEVPLEYFSKAFAWVQSQPSVTSGKIAVLGASRGGELALLLGASFPEVTAVVAELPSGLVWPGITKNGALGPAWTLGGQPLPFIAGVGSETKVTEPDGVVAYSDRGAFLASIAAATPAELAAATIHVEATHGPVLMLAGASDDLWPACDLSQIAMDRLASSGHRAAHGDELVCYPDAGHNVGSFTVGVPTTSAMHTMKPVEGEILALGGTPAGIAHAARDADRRLRAFLAANLR